VAATGLPELTCCDGEGEHHDRGDDAVVESALDIEGASYPHGDPLVVDDLCAERRIGRSQRGADEARECPRDVVEEPGRGERADEQREWKTDPQKAHGNPDVSSERRDIHPRRIREQQQRQRQLGEEVDRRCLDIDRQRPPVGVPQHEAGHREYQWTRDVPPSEAIGNDGPPEDQEDEDGERELRHRLVLRHLEAVRAEHGSVRGSASRAGAHCY
jgi:hypothetical protein